MTCDEARAILPEALTGASEDAPRAALEAHVAACPACRREADEVRRTIALLREAASAGAASAAAEAEAAVPRFDDVLRRVRSPARRVPGLLARAAALLLAALAGAVADRVAARDVSPFGTGPGDAARARAVAEARPAEPASDPDRRDGARATTDPQRAPLPPPPGEAGSFAERDAARDAVAAQPGGLAASLAVLRVLAEPGTR